MRSIKGDLERKRSALQSAIHSSMTRPTEFREILKDPYGSASLMHDEEMSAAVMERRALELKEAAQALEEIEAGRYGICRDCGQAIAPARMKVMPFATRCVACQAQQEGLRRAA